MTTYEASEGFTAQLADETVTVHAGHTRVSAGHPLLETHAESFKPCKRKRFEDGAKLVASKRFGVMEFGGVYLLAAASFREPARFLTRSRGGLDQVYDAMAGDPYRADEPLPSLFPEFFELAPA